MLELLFGQGKDVIVYLRGGYKKGAYWVRHSLLYLQKREMRHVCGSAWMYFFSVERIMMHKTRGTLLSALKIEAYLGTGTPQDLPAPTSPHFHIL